MHFRISYGSGQFLLGEMAYEKVEIGGITLPHQQIGLVETAYFPDPFSGILGLAYPLITSAFRGPQANSSQDSRAPNGNHVKYDPVSTSIINTKLNASTFSLGLSRNVSDSDGGYLVFGRDAPVATHGPTASTKLLKVLCRPNQSEAAEMPTCTGLEL